FKPVFDQVDSVGDDKILQLRAPFQEVTVLFFRTEIHHVFHTGSVVPASIEDHDLAGSRKVWQVAVYVHLTPLPIGRNWKGDYPEDTRADALGYSLDCSPFSGAIPALEHDNHAQALVLHPFLQNAELGLKPLQLFFVLLPLQLRFGLDRGLIALHDY